MEICFHGPFLLIGGVMAESLKDLFGALMDVLVPQTLISSFSLSRFLALSLSPSLPPPPVLVELRSFSSWDNMLLIKRSWLPLGKSWLGLGAGSSLLQEVRGQ
jgi:hypothetical protein